MPLWGLEREEQREAVFLPHTGPAPSFSRCLVPLLLPPTWTLSALRLLLQSLGLGISARQSPCHGLGPSASSVVWNNSRLPY